LVPASFREPVVPKIKGKQDEQRRKQEVRDSGLYEGSSTYLQAARAHVVAMLLKRSTYSLRVALYETGLESYWLWCLASGEVHVLPFKSLFALGCAITRTS